jgi:DNA-binding MarR family transcriptional regulator
MNHNAWKTGFMGSAKQEVLEALESSGPLTVPELPRAWPVTRALLEFLVEHLEEAGFIERLDHAGIPGKRAVRITAQGSAYLRSRPVETMNTVQFYSRPVTAPRSRAVG